MKKLCFLFAVIMIFIMSCSNNKEIKGYIPVGVEPSIVFTNNSGLWEPTGTILVVTDDSEPIYAHFELDSNWPGVRLVKYRNSYPPVMERRVYVRMTQKDSLLWIGDAQLDEY